MDTKKFEYAYQAILNAQKILLVIHDRPDGDALGSICAFIEFLTGLAKPYTAFCQNTPPVQFSFLPHLQKIISDKNGFIYDDFDLVIVLDCGGLNKTGLTEEIRHRPENQIIVEFDHHPKIDSYAAIEIKESALSSTAEVIYHFFKINKIRINKMIANCLLTGLMTDTANFLHDSTKDSTIKIASEMLLAGAQFPQILENTWRNKSLSAMKLWGEALNNLEINNDYHIAFTILPLETLQASQAADEELEGLAGFLNNLYGVNALLLLREEARNRIKGSLRTNRSDVNISYLAQFLGGGGHPKASAFVLNFSLTKTDGKWSAA